MKILEIWSSKFGTFKIGLNLSRQGPCKTWSEIIRSDLKGRKTSKGLVKTNTCSLFLRHHSTYANMKNRY